jgi:hypothetical protein
MGEIFKARVEKYFLEFVPHDSPHSRNPWVIPHCQRYVNSMLFIEQELAEASSVLEVGSPGAFTDGLRLLFPDLPVENTSTDLRTVFTDKTNHYDLLLNMEVIEHIKDLEVQDVLHRDSYVGDGLKNFVNTCYACLKPGGKMFLTTPNLSSLNTLWRVMAGGSPFSYEMHVRELSINDLRAILTQAGFTVLRHATLNCYDPVVPPEKTRPIMDLLAALGCETRLRNEVHFVVALKPGS